jgi:hypothetical protein
MTPEQEQWEVHWNRIRDDHEADGALPVEAAARADAETPVQFGPRPTGETS